MKIAIVNKATLQIESWYDADAPDQGRYGGPWGDAEQTEHLALDGDDHNGVSAILVEATEEVPEHIALQVDQAAQDAAAMEVLRMKRDAKLAACDWTQMPDSPLSAEDKAAWAAHRQALRDLPANTVDPKAPVWPSEPA